MFSSHFIPSPERQRNRGWKKLNRVFQAESFKSFSLQVFSLTSIANESPQSKLFPGERRQKTTTLETHHRYGEIASMSLLLLWLTSMYHLRSELGRNSIMCIAWSTLLTATRETTTQRNNRTVIRKASSFSKSGRLHSLYYQWKFFKIH